jgi:predicted peptidase
MRKKYPCFVMAPAVSRAGNWAVPKGTRKLRGKQLLPTALQSLEEIKKTHPIDADRIYVTVQSMGGYGTFGAIATSPQTFAAAIPLRGGSFNVVVDLP